MRFVRVCRINNEHPSSRHCVFSPIRYIDCQRIPCMCMRVWAHRLGFGRHGVLMNGGCRLHARGTPEKIFKFVFTPPVRPVSTLVVPSALASWLPRPWACDIRLRGKWTYKYIYISYVNSDEIYPTALPLTILPAVPALILFIPLHPIILVLFHSQFYYLFV